MLKTQPNLLVKHDKLELNITFIFRKLEDGSDVALGHEDIGTHIQDNSTEAKDNKRADTETYEVAIKAIFKNYEKRLEVFVKLANVHQEKANEPENPERTNQNKHENNFQKYADSLAGLVDKAVQKDQIRVSRKLKKKL